MISDLHPWGGILFHSSEQNCFSSVILEGLPVWTASWWSNHNIPIAFKSCLRLLSVARSAIFFFNAPFLTNVPFRAELLDLFWLIVTEIIFCLLSPVNVPPKVFGIIETWQKYATVKIKSQKTNEGRQSTNWMLANGGISAIFQLSLSFFSCA